MTVEPHEIGLRLPADTRYLQVVRLTAAGVAAEAGLTVAEIDDVKIAIDELCSILMHAAADGVELVFGVGEGRLAVQGHVVGTGAGLVADELVLTIVEATVDGFELIGDPPTGFGFDKRRSAG